MLNLQIKALTVAARAFMVLRTSDLTLIDLSVFTANGTTYKCTRLLQIILDTDTKENAPLFTVIHIPPA